MEMKNPADLEPLTEDAARAIAWVNERVSTEVEVTFNVNFDARLLNEALKVKGLTPSPGPLFEPVVTLRGSVKYWEPQTLGDHPWLSGMYAIGSGSLNMGRLARQATSVAPDRIKLVMHLGPSLMIVIRCLPVSVTESEEDNDGS